MSDRILVVYTFATLLLAGAAFWAIWQNHSLQKRERRERLLNEIVEWAMDVATCEFSHSITAPSPIFSRLHEKPFREYEFEDKKELAKGIRLDIDRYWQNQLMNLHQNYQVLGTKGEHILSLSNTEYFRSIINTVKKVKAQISVHENELWEYMKDMDDKSRRGELENRAEKLHLSAVELIKEATKIQTKDIS